MEDGSGWTPKEGSGRQKLKWRDVLLFLKIHLKGERSTEERKHKHFNQNIDYTFYISY